MKKSAVLAIALLFPLLSCGSRDISEELVAVKFGMSESQLSAIGFSCDVGANTCQLDNSKKLEIFGLPAGASVRLDEGKASEIDFFIDLYSEDEVIEIVTKKYGRPETCRFVNALTMTIERHVWLSNDGSTLNINRVLERGIAPTMPQFGKSSSLIFRGSKSSEEFKKVSC